MTDIIQYVVTDTETKTIFYSGNNAFKAVQNTFGHGNATIKFSGDITEAVFNQVIALQERLN